MKKVNTYLLLFFAFILAFLSPVHATNSSSSQPLLGDRGDHTESMETFDSAEEQNAVFHADSSTLRLAHITLCNELDMDSNYGSGGINMILPYSYLSMQRTAIFSDTIVGPAYVDNWESLHYGISDEDAPSFTARDGLQCIQEIGGRDAFKNYQEIFNARQIAEVKTRGYENSWIIYIKKLGETGTMAMNGVKGNREDLGKMLAGVSLFIGSIFCGYFLFKNGIPMLLSYLGAKPVIVKVKRLSWRFWRSKKVETKIEELHYGKEVSDFLEKELEEDILRVQKNEKKKGMYEFGSVLLYGPPGTGKTAFAREYAAAADFDYVYVGGASWAQLGVEDGLQSFKNTISLMSRNRRPVLCFIDEVDSIFLWRGKGTALDSKMVNDFLAEIDKASHVNIKFVFATNYKEALDPAILSRISRKISIGMPDEDSCQKMYATYLGKYCSKYGVKIEKPSLTLYGLTGRDIESCCRSLAETVSLLERAISEEEVVGFFNAKKEKSSQKITKDVQNNELNSHTSASFSSPSFPFWGWIFLLIFLMGFLVRYIAVRKALRSKIKKEKL